MNKNTDRLNINEWAARRVVEITADVKSYVADGWDVEEALDFVRKGTTLSDKYFMQVVENVFKS